MKKTLLKKSLLLGETIFGLILILVIIVSVFPLIPPFKNYYHSRTVLTGSMEPKIPKGSVVINQWADQKNFSIGDVITYQHPADKKIIYITHRIVKIDKTGLLWKFETKGDVNPAADFGLVTQAGIEGKVILMIPLIGYLIELFKTPVGFILLVALPLLIFIIQQIRDVLRLWPKLTGILVIVSFFAARVSFVTFASFTSGQATITGVTLSTAAGDSMPPVTGLSFNGYSINEKVLNPGFELGLVNWQTEGEVNITAADGFTAPYNGTKMARIGHTADDGQEIWENKLTQQIQPGAKNLSFYYNFFSSDSDSFDDPGMIVRLNDHNVFYLTAADIDNFDSPNSSGWTQLSFDISQIPDPVLEIIFYSGNTGDNTNQSWVYIDDVSTSEAVADDTTDFILTVNEPAQTHYSLDGGLNWLAGTTFNLTAVTGGAQVNYYSVDLAGNIEGINTRRLIKDAQKPDIIIDLIATATSKQTVNLSWTSPSDPPNASSSAVYDIRYSLSEITEDNFYDATPSANPPAPHPVGSDQEFVVSDLNSAATYYFAIKSADAALNWSLVFNSPSVTTLSELPEDEEDPGINPGDVVINELMWMGTSGSTADEYLELRNMTDQNIDLSGWQITKWVSGTSEELMLTIPSGKLIPAHSYFLIANFDQATSKINVDPDLVDNDLVLVNDNLQINLYDGDWTNPVNQTIDTADNGQGSPAAGEYNSGANIYYSMERDATPGNGYDANVWHTIFDDSALMHSYWDLDAVEKGTPGAPNLSQTVVFPSPTPTPLPPLTTDLTLFYANHSVSFIVSNIADFKQLNYTLTYDNDSGPQGITGTKEIKGEDKLEIKDLLLGSCSSGGTCVYHQNVKQINLEVVLSGAIERTLTTSLAL